jgi:hypothetical protein
MVQQSCADKRVPKWSFGTREKTNNLTGKHEKMKSMKKAF